MAPSALFWRRLLPLLCGLGWSGARAAEVIPSAPTAYFSDYAHLVRPSTAAGPQRQAGADRTGTPRARSSVVVYPKMQSDSSIEDYTVRVAQSWRVGQKAHDNGAVLFVFAQEHKLYVQTGYGLEGALPDALCKRIIDNEIIPRFRQNDFDGGLTAGVNAIQAAIRGEYRGTGATVGDQRHGFRSSGGVASAVRIAFFVILFIVLSFFRSRRQVALYGSGPRSRRHLGRRPLDLPFRVAAAGFLRRRCWWRWWWIFGWRRQFWRWRSRRQLVKERTHALAFHDSPPRSIIPAWWRRSPAPRRERVGSDSRPHRPPPGPRSRGPRPSAISIVWEWPASPLRNGVLIFVAPRSRRFAIIGDQGVHEKCGESFWQELADAMSQFFKKGDFTSNT